MVAVLFCNLNIDVRNADCVQELRSIKNGYFDMVLTSPPFFNVEEYAGVPLPSDYEKWKSTFLRPMIAQCMEKLRMGGKMAIYIERVGNLDLPKDCIKIAEQYGMRQNPYVHFIMNYGASRRKEAGKGINIIVLEK